jgi:hypothetical protein
MTMNDVKKNNAVRILEDHHYLKKILRTTVEDIVTLSLSYAHR